VGLLEVAHEGTLFLDEVSKLNLEIQSKLLRVIQEKSFRRVGSTATRTSDMRIIAATNKDLYAAVHEGVFLEDLFYRLDILRLELPPLREREGDIMSLLDHFTGLHAEKMRISPKQFSREAVRLLTSHSWPGNVRELRNFCERISVLCVRPTVEAEDVAKYLTLAPTKEHNADLRIFDAFTYEDIKKIRLARSLIKHRAHEAVVRAAQDLGVTKSTIERTIREYGWRASSCGYRNFRWDVIASVASGKMDTSD
jgi:DNA-binding NtrC family response regulator